jgi:hypothetical protein
MDQWLLMRARWKFLQSGRHVGPILISEGLAAPFVYGRPAAQGHHDHGADRMKKLGVSAQADRRQYFGSRLSRMLVVALYSAVAIFASAANAANVPCSGNKGGIAGCQGDTFICNDGSVSESEKSCSAYLGGAASLLGSSKPGMSKASDGECTCKSGAYCTGPRGGRFCITDSGTKSYLRK